MPPNSKEHELLPIRLAQTADAQTQQPQRPRNNFLLFSSPVTYPDFAPE
jgi:hypothetical protein